MFCSKKVIFRHDYSTVKCYSVLFKCFPCFGTKGKCTKFEMFEMFFKFYTWCSNVVHLVLVSKANEPSFKCFQMFSKYFPNTFKCFSNVARMVAVTKANGPSLKCFHMFLNCLGFPKKRLGHIWGDFGWIGCLGKSFRDSQNMKAGFQTICPGTNR